jgi:hypothetical protein
MMFGLWLDEFSSCEAKILYIFVIKMALVGPTYHVKGGISHYTTLLYQRLKTRHEVVFFPFQDSIPNGFFQEIPTFIQVRFALRELAGKE